jgi:hypothetical protein
VTQDARHNFHVEIPQDIESPFGLDNLWTTLLLKGRMQRVTLLEEFAATDPERGKALDASLSSSAWATTNIRKISSGKRPKFICGWGSFEHEDYHNGANQGEILAFHISEAKGSKGYLFSNPKYIAGFRMIYTVLT